MKVLNQTLDVICNILTKYFLLWCPKESVKDCSCMKCDEMELTRYQEYYAKATRWA
jgi:hypothetical protein